LYPFLRWQIVWFSRDFIQQDCEVKFSMHNYFHHIPSYGLILSFLLGHSLAINTNLPVSIQVDRLLVAQTIKSELPSTILPTCTSVELESYITALTDPWQRERALRQLVMTCGQTANPSLIRILQSEGDIGIRQAAAGALGDIGGSAAIQALIITLGRDPAPIVRRTAAEALGYIHDTAALNPLISTLKNSKELPSIREAATEALGRIGGTNAIEALIATLKNTAESLNLRQAAVKSLQQIGDTTTDALGMALQSSDLRTRYWAVATLSEINSPRSIKILETNKVNVAEILEAAYESDIVAFDRAPAASTTTGAGKQLSRKPLLCKVPWISEKWSKCQ
jgi:HEAT repeats